MPFFICSFYMYLPEYQCIISLILSLLIKQPLNFASIIPYNMHFSNFRICQGKKSDNIFMFFVFFRNMKW